MAFDIGTLLGGNLGQLFKDIVGTFKLDPTKKAELQAVIDANSHEIQMKEFELQVKTIEMEKTAIETASANIRAEAQSGDKFTSRARPTFLYLFYCILAFNYLMLPIIQMIGSGWSNGFKLIEFPDILWEVFVAGFLGYTGVRTWEKMQKK